MKKLYLILLLTSCSLHESNIQPTLGTENEIFPSSEEVFRNVNHSFLKIARNISILDCLAPDFCIPLEGGVILGSSFIVQNYENGSLIFTAEHLCQTEEEIIKELKQSSYYKETQKFYISTEFIDSEGNVYKKANVVYKDKKKDICGIFIEDLKKPALKAARRPPVYGETIYNIAAPFGFYLDNKPVLYLGIYFGDANFYENKVLKKTLSLFSLPTIGGSSGSPVLNKFGEFISILQSKPIGLDTVGMGSSFYETIEAYKFLTENYSSDSK